MNRDVDLQLNARELPMEIVLSEEVYQQWFVQTEASYYSLFRRVFNWFFSLKHWKRRRLIELAGVNVRRCLWLRMVVHEMRMRTRTTNGVQEGCVHGKTVLVVDIVMRTGKLRGGIQVMRRGLSRARGAVRERGCT